MKRKSSYRKAGIGIFLILLYMIAGISIWPQPGRAGCSSEALSSDHGASRAKGIQPGPGTAASRQPLFIAYSCNTWGRIKPVKA